jgi:hypothetical protein
VLSSFNVYTFISVYSFFSTPTNICFWIIIPQCLQFIVITLTYRRAKKNKLGHKKEPQYIWRWVWRYKWGNQNPYIEKGQTTQWPREKGQKDKQRNTKHTHKTKDRVTNICFWIIIPQCFQFIVIILTYRRAKKNKLGHLLLNNKKKKRCFPFIYKIRTHTRCKNSIWFTPATIWLK